MKKNAMLKIAAILMVAVLLTTCAISSTFAKYVTAPENATNTARVAKWGVEVIATADNAFATEYKDGSEVAVKSQTSDKVVAPGTEADTAFSLTVTGKPEVDAEVTVDTTDFVVLTGWNITEGGSAKDYCPIKFKVAAGAAGATELEFYVTGPDHSTADATDTIDTVNDLQAAINKYIGDHFVGAEYEAEGASGTITPIDMYFSIDWEWVFAGETTTGAYHTDARDTLLGDLTTAPTITFNAEVSVVQTGA